jgi:hypothetical protein
VTDYLSRISQRVRDNVKDWYEAAGKKAADQTDEQKAFETLKLLASLLAEGTSAREVAALNLVFAQNKDVSVAHLIKCSREHRADPVVAPFLNFLKETLLPGVIQDETADLAAQEKAKAQRIKSGKLVYESTAISQTLLTSFGQTPQRDELKTSQERYETALGRKLNDDELFA